MQVSLGGWAKRIVTFRALLIAEVGANDQVRKLGLQTLLRASESQMTFESRVRKNTRSG
jgi:hypothetical protein